ncbi:hypothetical protein HELRODRAFT_162463 [Helobdella robusta]|uniref:Ig-like domain-containing protein n=1 Tax=Helobdella robusta TaxID=6412 RepID=T1ESP7_HELRO|nr:hypothetical protein HELRODRAFT_162463 [Helobdella robusta]ESN98988.1 hypothetical protein HELRODRAFT_162463 [Helobdella robusta]
MAHLIPTFTFCPHFIFRVVNLLYVRDTYKKKPRIVEGPKDMVVKEHENVVFNCRATGDPEPTIIWKKLNSNIPQGRSFIQDNKSLKIEKVDSSDEGIYICRAENAFGFQESGVQLNVHCELFFVSSDVALF